jgi:hypothetical protein
MKGDSYIPGALVLARSIRETKSRYPTVCMYTDDVSSGGVDILRRYFDEVVLVPIITGNVIPMMSEKQKKMYGGWINASFTKWNCLTGPLLKYNKVVFVDADIIFLSNIDDLFELNAPAATFSWPWATPYKKDGMVNPYGKIPHAHPVDSAIVHKSLHDNQPSFVGLGSLVLLKPSQHAFDVMMGILQKREKYGHRMCISGWDEQILAETMLACRETFHNIHQRYNWMAGKDNWLDKGDKPLTRHYFNDKPWNIARDAWPDLADWWAHADAIVLAHPEAAKWFTTKHKS